MAFDLINILCEGPHDAAFLNRILKSHGFEANERVKLGEYPSPLGSLLSQSAQRADVVQLNISEARQVFLPNHVLKREDLHVFLYSIGGDSKRDARMNFLRKLRLLTDESPGEIQRVPGGTNIGVAFLFDADDHGTEVRLKQIEQEVVEVFSDYSQAQKVGENGMAARCAGLAIGCYVFSAEDSQNGRLEDLLLPLMRTENEGIFHAAQEFIETHLDIDRLKFLRIRKHDGQLVEERGNDSDYDFQKSIIGVAAQLQISGKPNAACINRSDYLIRNKIIASAKCSEIVNFLEHFSKLTGG